MIVAGGPSAAHAGLEAAKGRAALIAINEGRRLAPWADVLYACDLKWWRLHDGAKDFPGLAVTQDRTAAEEFGLCLVTLRHGNALLLDEPGVIGSGGNGGFQALNLALQFGARKIILVGYDLTLDGGEHWHGAHPKPLNNPGPEAIARWRQALDDAAPALADLGATVINASRVSALANYPKMSLEDALDAHA